MEKGEKGKEREAMDRFSASVAPVPVDSAAGSDFNEPGGVRSLSPARRPLLCGVYNLHGQSSVGPSGRRSEDMHV